jgi:glyoxylase-like metal-dependent hydrolase (beta-lactamase superfamily II)
MLPLPDGLEAAGRRVVPVHAPGHSKDHTVYFVPSEGWLFSGDLFLGERIKYFRADEQFGEQILSLKRILTLDFEALFCAHRPVLRGGRTALARKLGFLEALYGRITELHRRGYDARAICRALDPRSDRLARAMTLGNVSFACMVSAALRSLTAGGNAPDAREAVGDPCPSGQEP